MIIGQCWGPMFPLQTGTDQVQASSMGAFGSATVQISSITLYSIVNGLGRGSLSPLPGRPRSPLPGLFLCPAGKTVSPFFDGLPLIPTLSWYLPLPDGYGVCSLFPRHPQNRWTSKLNVGIMSLTFIHPREVYYDKKGSGRFIHFMVLLAGGEPDPRFQPRPPPVRR